MAASERPVVVAWQAPLEKEKKGLADRLAAVKAKMKKADNERIGCSGPIANVQSEGENLLHAIGKLEKKGVELTKRRADVEKSVEDVKQRIADAKAQLEEEHEVPFEQRKAALDAAVRAALDTVRGEDEALRELRQREVPLKRSKADAHDALGAVDDAHKRKMSLVVSANRRAAEAAFKVEHDDALKDRVLGPMMMSIDVPNPQHQVCGAPGFAKTKLLPPPPPPHSHTPSPSPLSPPCHCSSIPTPWPLPPPEGARSRFPPPLRSGWSRRPSASSTRLASSPWTTRRATS